MSDLKIAFFGVKPWERELIEKEIINLDTVGIGIFEEEVQDKIDLAKNYEVISPFIYSKLDKDTIGKLPNLKMIATRSTGMDHIDVDECKARNIVVKNVPTYGSHTVAEYTFGLILAVTKKIVTANQAVEDGEFNPQGLTGIDLEGKTLGVVGVGKIGQNVVRIARGFRMKVLAVEREPDLKLAKNLGFRYTDLETLLKESDIVTMHVPYFPATKDGPGTHHLINTTNIKLMKKGSYLINTSRGPIVETEAIIMALNKGILAGAGLDVTEEENLLESCSTVLGDKTSKDDLKEILSYHMLRDRDDVVFTPHNAFNTREALERIVRTTVESIGEMMKKN